MLLLLVEYVKGLGGFVHTGQLKSLYEAKTWLKSAVGNLSVFCKGSKKLIYHPRTDDAMAAVSVAMQTTSIESVEEGGGFCTECYITQRVLARPVRSAYRHDGILHRGFICGHLKSYERLLADAHVRLCRRSNAFRVGNVSDQALCLLSCFHVAFIA